MKVTPKGIVLVTSTLCLVAAGYFVYLNNATEGLYREALARSEVPELR
jgi:hypothetical protein